MFRVVVNIKSLLWTNLNDKGNIEWGFCKGVARDVLQSDSEERANEAVVDGNERLSWARPDAEEWSSSSKDGLCTAKVGKYVDCLLGLGYVDESSGRRTGEGNAAIHLARDFQSARRTQSRVDGAARIDGNKHFTPH